jgi:hypothetical protein
VKDEKERLCRKCDGRWKGPGIHTCYDYSGGDVVILSDIGDSNERQNKFLMNYDKKQKDVG